MVRGQIATEDAAAPALERLTQQVLEANPQVQDSLEVSALIESLGWTDGRIRTAFGYPSVFELGEALYQRITHQVRSTVLPPKTGWNTWTTVRRMVWDFGHGLTFTLPMMVSVFSMITIHISFASYQYFPVDEATALAVATFLSFVTTGGFSQVIANVYYMLVDTQGPAEVQVNVLRILGWGLGMTGVLAVVLWVLDSAFPVMPLGLMSLTVLYMVLLSGLWLSFAGLYVLRREYMLAVITGIGAGLAFWLHSHGWSVVGAQTIAIMAASVISLGASVVIFKIAHRQAGFEGTSVVRPRPSQLAFATRQYFLYGMLYFIFVFADRLIAWSTNTVYLPLNIWFRGQYELGMDWSLAALFAPLSLAETVIGYYLRWLDAAQHEVPVPAVAVLAARSRRIYFRLFALFGLFSVVGVLLARLAVARLVPDPTFAPTVPVHGVEPFVFAWSSVAYVLLALALLNILLMFSLSYPEGALRVLLRALLLDVGVGVVLTRILGGYQYAVLGVMVGAFYLMVATTWEVLKIFRRIDYLLYRLT
jgi:hypothetical protein